MNFVKQKHSKGCGIAAAAMITGKSYDQIHYEWYGRFGKVDGINIYKLIDYIRDKGFECIELDCYNSKKEFLCDCKTPRFPFHLIEILVYPDSSCSHFVIMDEAGKLYDPIFGETKWTDYHGNPYMMFGILAKEKR